MKKVIFVSMYLIAVSLFGIKYYAVNKNAATEYYEKNYCINEWIELEDCELKVNSYNVNVEDNGQVEVVLKVSIKNTGDNTMDLEKSTLNDSVLGIGNIQSGMFYLAGKKSDAKVEFGEIVNVEMIGKFSVDLEKVKNGEEIKLYISGKNYIGEIENYLKDKILYSKYVKIGAWMIEK